MARPKMTVAAALGRGRAQGNTVHPTVQEVMRSMGVSPGGVGAKQAVKLENGRVVHMRAKKATTSQEDHSGVDHSGVEDEHNQDRFEKQSLPGGGSSSVNLESNEEDLAASNQRLASDDRVQTCVTPQGTQNFGKREGEAEFVCTACGHSVAIAEVRAHPVLHVAVCDVCYEFLFSSPFTKDNPLDPSEHENECRWCGDGGEVVLCDTCPKAFCKPCIKRNFGADVLNAIESPTRQWRCFVCDDDLLQTLIRDYNNVENQVKTMNRNGQPQKRRTSSECNPRIRSRSRYINKTTFPDDTIATIIAREKANLQREHPEKHFNGFEVQKKRRPKQSRQSLFARSNITQEHGTSKRDAPIPEVHLL